MAGFVSPEMQAKLSQTGYSAAGPAMYGRPTGWNQQPQMPQRPSMGPTQLPGAGTTGAVGYDPRTMDMLRQHMASLQSAGQQPGFVSQQTQEKLGATGGPTSFAGPAMYGQPTGWNQQRPPQSQGNPFQLPGDGTTPTATSFAGPAMYGQPTGWNQQPQASGMGGSYQNPNGMAAMMQQERERQRLADQQAYNQRMQGTGAPPASGPSGAGTRTLGANMAQYQNRGPQQQGGQTWQPPVNPGGVYSPAAQQQNMQAMQAALQFRNSGATMRPMQDPGMNQNYLGSNATAMPYNPANLRFQQTQYNMPGQAFPR